jgi:hypothetical protein
MQGVSKNIVVENIERIFWLHPAVLGLKSLEGKSDESITLFRSAGFIAKTLKVSL